MIFYEPLNLPFLGLLDDWHVGIGSMSELAIPDLNTKFYFFA